MPYTADFETCDDRGLTADGIPTEVHVWLWATCDIDTLSMEYGTSIYTFLEYMHDNPDAYWFHNLAYDGTHIVDALLRAGWPHVQGKEHVPGTFSTLISDSGKWYHVGITWGDGTHVDIYDSLKKFPMSVAAIAKRFDMPVQKGEIDYTEWRPWGYVPTADEIEYISGDVGIMARAMAEDYEQGLTKMTIGADCMRWYKRDVGERWETLFPQLNTLQDAQLREAYRGGYCAVDDRYKGVDVYGGISVDYNSMYPSMMISKPYPVGRPVYFTGRYETDDAYPLYVQTLTCTFHVKHERLAMVQLKRSPWYGQHEYVRDTVEAVTLTLSSVDLDLFFLNYDVDVWSWDGGYKFKSQKGIFDDYISYWAGIKETSEGAQRYLAKLFLNNLYGKFGTNPNVTGKIPVLADPYDVVRFETGAHEERPPVYVPVAIFATAYARDTLIRAILGNRERFIYCDTDSIHLTGTDAPDGLPLDDNLLCHWKVEGGFSRARHLRPKTYIWDLNGRLDVKCAGMSAKIKELCTFDNFYEGFSNMDSDGRVLEGYGKLVPYMCRGGRTLVERPFKIS